MVENFLRRGRLDFSEMDELLDEAEDAMDVYPIKTTLNINNANDLTVNIPITVQTATVTVRVNGNYIGGFKTTGLKDLEINLPSGQNTIDVCGGQFIFATAILGSESNNASLSSIEFGANYGNSISANAFQGCLGLTTIVIPNNIQTIGNYAFDGCTNLTNLTMSTGLTQLGQYAFRNTNIRACVLPSAVTKIENGTFYGCANLQTFTINSTVTEIGTSAFMGCTRLTSINIPSSVTTMRYRAFENCTGLRTAYLRFTTANQKMTGMQVFPVYHAWFYGCNSSLVLHIPASVTSPSTTYGQYWNYRGTTSSLTYYADL